MTVLCGDPTFSSYSVAGPSGNDGAYVAPIPFIAGASGQVSSLFSYLNPVIPQQFVMALYDGVNQLLVYSSPVTVNPGGGLTSFPVVPTAMVAGQAYQIALFPQGSGAFTFGVDSSSSSSSLHVVGANSTFPIPPQILSGAIPIGYPPPAFFADGDASAQTTGTSGIIGQEVMQTRQILEMAFARCKIRTSLITDEMIYKARKELFMFLTSDLANLGPQLFAVDIQVLPFTAGLAGVNMPAGTIDVLNVNLRQQFALQSSASPQYSPATPTVVNTIGITWAGPAVPIQILQNGQLLLRAQPNASAGETTLIDMDGAVASTSYQVIADPTPPNVNAAGPLLVNTVTFYQTAFQVPLAPYSRDDFANLNNTFFIGRPFQYWLDRQEPWPIMRLWPTPGINEQQNACLVIWRHRQIMDVGDLFLRLNIPNRWLAAVTDGLAARLAYVVKEVEPTMIPILEARADKSLRIVRSEEREKGPMRIQPQIYRYTM